MMLKLVIISLLVNITCRNVLINCAEGENLVKDDGKKPAPSISPLIGVHLNTNNADNVKPPVEKQKGTAVEIANKNKNNVTSSTFKPIPIRANSKNDLLQSGALIRGFYVFLGLSVITVFYFVYRSYRLRHGSQPSTTVKKYGVTARRSDMEMRPLELDDEDDDTLFEVNTLNVNR